MADKVIARVMALRTADIQDLKAQWRTLFATEPPKFNRRYLESRLAYRIQELAYGGLSRDTVARLQALASNLDNGRGAKKRTQDSRRPVAGTRLIREWQGVEHCVTVRNESFDYQGQPFKSLSSVARAITGTRWNGWEFFGLKNHRGRS